MFNRYPCSSVRPSVRVRIHTKRHSLSKSKSFDLNLMELGYIVKYHYVFFKFDNDPYRTMP